jgi:multidrug efflux pump subunit AcrB
LPVNNVEQGPKGLGDLFYRLPRLTFLAVGFIALMGIAAFVNLARQEDPTMTERYGDVLTYMPGASALRMETLVTEKVENALREVPEIKTLRSTTRAGFSFIDVELYDSVSKDQVDLVWSEARDKLGELAINLPAESTEPLVTARGPLAVTLGFAIEAENTPDSISERIATELKSRLAALPGTKETEIYGEPQQEILVAVDADALARVNLSINNLASIINAADTRLAAGELKTRGSSLIVEVKGDLDSVERIKSVPILRQANGNFLRLGDIASITKGYKSPADTLAMINGKRSIMVTTMMETGRRVDQWSAAAKAIAAAYAKELPEMVHITVVIDQNYYTNERLTALMLNLLAAIALVLLALFFLMGARSALIVGAALPLTLCLVLAGLKVMDIPLHQMSVTGLIIALGLLIDNAIVVVEEYKLNRRRGDSLNAAISHSVKHLFVPLLASTATTVFAFMPIATSPGGTGDFTGAMAISVILSVTASFFLAMTLIPTFAAYLDRRFPIKESDSHAWWVKGYTNAGIAAVYRRSIGWIVRHPAGGVAISLVLPVLGFMLATTLTSSFFPPVDRNQFQVQITLPANASLSDTKAAVDVIHQDLMAMDEVIESQWFIGEGAPRVYYNMMDNNDGVESFANGFVTTRDVDDPRRILPELQKRLMKVLPQARVMVMPFEQGPPFSAPIELRVIGPNLAVLKELGEQLRFILSGIDAVTYSTATLSGSSAQLSVYPKDNQLAMLGMRNQDLPRQLNGELSGIEAGSVMEGSTQIPISVRYTDNVRGSLDAISASPVMAGNNFAGYGGIPLEQVADVVLEPSPANINRYQGERVNTVSGFLLPYAFPSLAVAEFRERLAAADIKIPEGYRIAFGGEEEERGNAVSNIVSTFTFYLWLMVAVIVLSLNSFRYAGVIGIIGIASIGLALFGVWLSGYPFGYMALIGALGLVGLAINGGIIVLSALKADSASKRGDVDAMVLVVMDATRHIVSTTVTTIGGFLPLILFGGHFWPPLAMAIAGGVAGSAILALYLVPAMFSHFARKDQARAQGLKVQRQAIDPSTAAAV